MYYEDEESDRVEKDCRRLALARELDRLSEGDGEDPHFWEKILCGGFEAQKETFGFYCHAISNWGLRKQLLTEPLEAIVPTELHAEHVRRQCRERGEVMFFWLNLVPPGDPTFDDDSPFDRAAYGPMTDAAGSSRPATEAEIRLAVWHAAQLADGEHLTHCTPRFKTFLAGFWRERWPFYDERPLTKALVVEWLDYVASGWNRHRKSMRLAALLGVNPVRLARRIERIRLEWALFKNGL